MSAVLIEDRLQIPRGIDSLEAFRRWVRSEAFPAQGRIDYIAGTIEVDLQERRFVSHGGILAEFLRVLASLVKNGDLGEIYFSNCHVASVPAEFSAEPDIMFISHGAFDSGRVKAINHTNRHDDVIEIEGPIDMVAEIVSDSSVTKDTQRLPAAYYAAGIREYWLVDARGDDLLFTLFRRGAAAFEPTPPDAEGFQASAVYSHAFKLTRQRDRRGHWRYDLLMK